MLTSREKVINGLCICGPRMELLEWDGEMDELSLGLRNIFDEISLIMLDGPTETMNSITASSESEEATKQPSLTA